MKKNQKGFTLMEMLIVVAVIAILVAVAIPVMNAQMHKVKVRTDWANVRAYYAEIQTDYMLTGEYNPKVKLYGIHTTGEKSITFLDGQTVPLKVGVCIVSFTEGEGYGVIYYCAEKPEDRHPECQLVLNAS